MTAGWLSNEFVLNKLRMGDNEAYRKIADNEFYMPYFKPDRTYPPIFFDDETAEELSFLEADIGNYVESQYAKWVVDGGIDEQWTTTSPPSTGWGWSDTWRSCSASTTSSPARPRAWSGGGSDAALHGRRIRGAVVFSASAACRGSTSA